MRRVLALLLGAMSFVSQGAAVKDAKSLGSPVYFRNERKNKRKKWDGEKARNDGGRVQRVVGTRVVDDKVLKVIERAKSKGDKIEVNKRMAGRAEVAITDKGGNTVVYVVSGLTLLLVFGMVCGAVYLKGKNKVIEVKDEVGGKDKNKKEIEDKTKGEDNNKKEIEDKTKGEDKNEKEIEDKTKEEDNNKKEIEDKTKEEDKNEGVIEIKDEAEEKKEIEIKDKAKEKEFREKVSKLKEEYAKKLDDNELKSYLKYGLKKYLEFGVRKVCNWPSREEVKWESLKDGGNDKRKFDACEFDVVNSSAAESPSYVLRYGPYDGKMDNLGDILESCKDGYVTKTAYLSVRFGFYAESEDYYVHYDYKDPVRSYAHAISNAVFFCELSNRFDIRYYIFFNNSYKLKTKGGYLYEGIDYLEIFNKELGNRYRENKEEIDKLYANCKILEDYYYEVLNAREEILVKQGKK